METTVKSFTELDVWKAGRALANLTYSATRTFPKEEKYGLADQMRRAAVSIPSNIAEGCGRNHAKDTLQFLYVSRGSLCELETQFYIASDQGFLHEQTLKQGFESISRTRQLLSGFIRYVNSSIPKPS